MLNLPPRKPHKTARAYARAGLRTIATLGILLLGGFLNRSASAQVVSTRAVVAMHAAVKRPVPQAQTVLQRPTSAASSTINSAQGPGGSAIGPGPGCNLFPAPASIGTSVPLSYFGPPPSDTNRSLVGPVQLLNTGQVDAAHGTITIPLYLGHLNGSGKNVWYILTDVDDPDVAAELGLNFSAKLTFASHSARTGNMMRWRPRAARSVSICCQI